MPVVYFVINQDLADGSAHALYLGRHLRALAENAPPGWRVEALLPTTPPFSPAPGNLSFKILPAWRKRSTPSGHRRGWQVNAVFHFFAARELRRVATPDDWVGTASFPVLFESLYNSLQARPEKPRLFYEIHQMEELGRDPNHPKCRRERAALAHANLLFVTANPLRQLAARLFPDIPAFPVGLASSYQCDVKLPSSESPLRLGYFGSISREQGIPWLVENWPALRSGLPTEAARPELHIYGRSRPGEIPPPSNPANGIFVFPPRPESELPALAAELDGLIIPALDLAHRASIAFTKAYDFAGLGLPVLSADLPTIREVLPTEEDAWFFQPGDIPSLAACLATWATDPSARLSRANAAARRASDLSWATRSERWWRALGALGI